MCTMNRTSSRYFRAAYLSLCQRLEETEAHRFTGIRWVTKLRKQFLLVSAVDNHSFVYCFLLLSIFPSGFFIHFPSLWKTNIFFYWLHHTFELMIDSLMQNCKCQGPLFPKPFVAEWWWSLSHLFQVWTYFTPPKGSESSSKANM